MMTIAIEPAHEGHLAAVLGGLTKDQEGSRKVITNLFRRGLGFCAVVAGSPVGFLVFQDYAPDSDIHLIEVLPCYRRRKVAFQLMLAAEERLRTAGVKYIDLTCTSPASAELGKKLGYKVHADPEKPERLGFVYLRKSLPGR